MSGRIEMYDNIKEPTSKWSRNESFAVRAAGVDIGQDVQGGGPGTTDYNALENKPRINGHQLIGDKDSDADLDIPDSEPLTSNQFNTLMGILS